MTQPLKPGATPGRSEMGHGRGLAPDPRSDYQSQRAGLAGVLSAAHSSESGLGYSEDRRDVYVRQMAEKRSDPTNGQESIWPDMLYVKGNPDQFGPAAPIVQERVQTPPALFKQPIYRYGVDRED